MSTVASAKKLKMKFAFVSEGLPPSWSGQSVVIYRLLHEEGRPASEARAYLERWSLLAPERVAKSLEFLTHPTWRSYVSSYSCGYELCSSFVDGDPSRFRTLLTTQLTTADLRGGDA